MEESEKRGHGEISPDFRRLKAEGTENKTVTGN